MFKVITKENSFFIQWISVKGAFIKLPYELFAIANCQCNGTGFNPPFDSMVLPGSAAIVSSNDSCTVTCVIFYDSDPALQTWPWKNDRVRTTLLTFTWSLRDKVIRIMLTLVIVSSVLLRKYYRALLRKRYTMHYIILLSKNDTEWVSQVRG